MRFLTSFFFFSDLSFSQLLAGQSLEMVQEQQQEQTTPSLAPPIPASPSGSPQNVELGSPLPSTPSRSPSSHRVSSPINIYSTLPDELHVSRTMLKHFTYRKLLHLSTKLQFLLTRSLTRTSHLLLLLLSSYNPTTVVNFSL